MILSLHGTATAHGFLEYAVPAANVTFHGQPAEVRIWFTQSLEPAFCKIRVLDQDGKQVDKIDTHVDPIDPYLLRVSLFPLTPGSYRVAWRVVAVDSHASAGNYAFVVDR